MENYYSEERSTPDSCSTSDLGSQNDLIAGLDKQSRSKLCTKQKKILGFVFNSLKNKFCHLLDDPFELKSSINGEFLHESCESLAEKFEYRCCKNDQHSLHCEKKWNRIRKDLIEMVDDELKEPKPIFVIKKRLRDNSRTLLSPLQPSWVHRLLVQQLFSTSYN